MKKTIGLAPLGRLDLFLNLYKSLENLGYEVYFIGSRPRINKLYEKYNCKYLTDKKEAEEKNIKFDLIIFWTGLKDIHKRLVNWCKKNNIKTLFLENGYLPNTIQIDNRGVNFGNSISNRTYDEILKLEKTKCNLKIDEKKIVTDLKFKVSIKDYILWSFSINTIKGVIVEILNKFWSSYRNKVLYKNKDIKLPKKYVFIPLQVHDDTQIIYYSPIVKKMTDILDYFYKDIKEVLPEYKIVIKEHPMDIGRIKYPVKNLQKKYKDLVWLKGGNIDEILDKAEYVITINSSVGFQALNKCKKVLILGQAFYSNNPFVEVIKNKNEFKEKLLKLKNKKIDCNKTKEYVKKISELTFINGGLKSFNKDTIKEIICRIKKELNS